MDLSEILTLAVAAVAIILIIKILNKPIKLIFKVLINSAVGFIVLLFLNLLLGAGIEMVWYNYLLVGFLGVPGLIIAVLLHIF